MSEALGRPVLVMAPLREIRNDPARIAESVEVGEALAWFQQYAGKQYRWQSLGKLLFLSDPELRMDRPNSRAIEGLASLRKKLTATISARTMGGAVRRVESVTGARVAIASWDTGGGGRGSAISQDVIVVPRRSMAFSVLDWFSAIIGSPWRKSGTYSLLRPAGNDFHPGDNRAIALLVARRQFISSLTPSQLGQMQQRPGLPIASGLSKYQRALFASQRGIPQADLEGMPGKYGTHLTISNDRGDRALLFLGGGHIVGLVYIP